MFSFPWWLSLGIGFLSLSAEILWVRLLGFAYGGIPQAFSLVLASYLVGIAVGAMVGKRFCAGQQDLYVVAVPVLAASGVWDMLVPVVAPLVIRPSDNLFLPIVALLVVTTAGLKSVMFPIAHHLGSSQTGSMIGRSVSRIYFGNIIGSTLGPLVTSYFLLDVFGLTRCFQLIGMLCLCMATACVFKAKTRMFATAYVVASMAVAVAVISPHPQVEAMHRLADNHGSTIIRMIENKNGVVHIVSDPDGGDIVFGGNIYDGRATVDVERNQNHLERAYILALLHPRPKSVLIIGLSTGAWSRAIQGFPNVERIDIVEINPAYLDLIRKYPSLAPLLSDPRVRIYIDDGRRWLKRNPDAFYDMIVQNTTYHWRSNITNLLSRQYLEEVKGHLAPSGLFAFNTTSSFDVFRTCEEVFDFTYRYFNFAYASNTPLTIKPKEAERRMEMVLLPGGGHFPEKSPSENSVLNLLRTARLEPVSVTLQPARGWAAVITDDNMLTEFRHGKRFGGQTFTRYFLPPPVPLMHWKQGYPPVSAEYYYKMKE